LILIYSHTLSNRLKYVTDLIFKTVLLIDCELTDDLIYFQSKEIPKIAYTNNKETSSVYIHPDTILFETDVNQTLPVADKNYTDFPKFFASNTTDFLGYDLFAMVFYFTSRYEEYIPTVTDNHQRFKAENSISFQFNCLQKPFLNQAILDFSIRLNQLFPNLEFKKRNFNFISTIDIDNAFAYSNKGLVRNLAGLVNDLFKLRLSDVKQRIISILNEQKDPYNTFDIINQMSDETKTALHYFVLISDYSDYDKNPKFTNSNFQHLLKSLSEKFSIGLHPSYYSISKLENIEIEKKRLHDITLKPIKSARCHFLRLNFPETYRSFIKNGITDDYTMIYASQCGFRTGLCMPYKWFDLERNEQTELTIHTSVIMEGTLRDYNQVNANNALNTSLHLMSEVKKYGGEFISIFHNDSFTKNNSEWVKLYQSILKESKL
jgi:hypothetical protein